MKNYNLVLTVLILFLFCATLSQASYFNDTSPEVVRYKVVPDVIFGKGKILKAESKEGYKDLWMDVYYPVEESTESRPAIILTYGGSFHRGNPRVPYVGIGAQTTTMSQYAMRYAEEGFVCFTITYRVAPDNPIIGPYEGFTEDDLETDFFKTPEAIAQGNIIRGQMGLEKLTEENAVEIMKSAVIAAAEDLRTAIRYVKASSHEYNIDPERIALTGFSAGAVTTINVAFGMKEKVAAVIVNSGYPSVFNMEKLLESSSQLPPALIFLAQNDYPVVDIELKPFLKKLESIGAEYYFNWVPGFGHFYPSGATSLANDGSQMSVEQRSILFLKEKLNK